VNQEYYILIKKLKGFINKYYKNLILKGLLLGFSILFTMFLLVNTIEYFTWSTTVIRTFIFYTFISVAILVVIFYIAIPLFRLFKIGKTLSYQEAAKIIGIHFPEISDKLLNTIQLQKEFESSKRDNSAELLSAGIDQKAKMLSPLPFKNAIEIKNNIKYLKFVAPPLLAILIILLVFPAFITEPATRIVNHDVYYSKPLPYTLSIVNEKLEAFQKDDFDVLIKAEGEAIPADIYVDDGKYTHRMDNRNSGQFKYTFKNLSNDVYFQLKTDNYTSKKYHLKVLPKPIIYGFDVLLNYPNYLGKKSDKIENSGDLVVPEGTDIAWHIYAKDTRDIVFKKDNQPTTLKNEENNIFTHDIRAKTNFWYTLFAENKYLRNSDSLSFSVQVIKDEYPSIEVEPARKNDSEYGYLFFSGSINDDHGFHSLKLFYKKDSVVDLPWETLDLKIDNKLSKQHFNYAIRYQDIKINPGSGVTYYLEVRDNDALNRYKKTKSSIYNLHVDGKKEIKNKYDNTSNKVKEKIKQALAELDKINKSLEEKREELFDKKEINWSDKKQLSELLDKQKSLENQINELKQLNEELNKYEDMLNRENSEQLKDKIDQLNKMFEQLNTENLEKANEEIEKLDKDKLSELLKNLENKNENLKTDLEQNLELYKQLEVEKKMQENIDELNKLARDQKDLADKTGNKELSDENAQNEQKKIDDQFKDIEDSVNEVDSLNAKLDEPYDMKSDPQQIDSINSELDQADENLSKGKQKKASKNQQEAGQKMEKMASDMSMMMQSAMTARMGEDAEKIKKILDNLLDLSFNQESLMDKVNKTSLNDPKYVENLAELQLIKDGYLVLHDSLIAISKRQMAVKQFIVKESDKINLHINRALLYLQDRKRGQALNDQQYSMTSMNNLALMLSESLDQMQASMQASGQKSGQKCKNPGMGKPGAMDKMIQMQQGLNHGMKEGEKGDGLNGDKGLNKQSEKLARMAALQSEIRKQLSEYLNKQDGGQGNNGDLSRLVDEMKKTEEDIINRKITKETLERQKQIEVRLLKSKKAKLEQEKEETRESREGINRRSVKTNEINSIKEKEIKEDLLQTVPVEMSPYFNDLLKKYLYKLETDGS